MTREELDAALATARVFNGDFGPLGAVCVAYVTLYNERFASRVPLSKKQREVLDFIVQYSDEHRMAPTLREIAEHFDYRTLATVHEHLEILRRKGWIKREFNGSRGIEVLEGAA